MKQTGFAPFFSARFVKAYLVTMRPYLMFISGITGIAGLSFTPAVSPWNLSLIATASFLSYGFGQALTDGFQTDTDSISAAYRPLIQGTISKKQVFLISIIGLVGCILVFSIYYPANLLLGAVGGTGLATYTFFKRRWWAGPLYNAWIVAVLFIMAFAAGSGRAFLPTRNLLLALGIVFWGYANFVISGYLKDVEADRSTGYATFPVVFGRKYAALASDAVAALTMMPLALFIISSDKTHIFFWAPFLSAGTLFLIAGQIRLHHVQSDSQAHRAIAPIVNSYLLFLSCIVLINRPEWLAYIVLFTAGYFLTIRLRPERHQI